MTGNFLFAAQILGAAAVESSLSAQVRTPSWPSPPGSPDRALIRLNSSPLEDMDIPRRYDLEVVCDPTLAVIPPMGNALLPGGLLILNAPEAPCVLADGPRIVSADLTTLALDHDSPLACALSGAAWAALGVLTSEWHLPIEALEKGTRAVMPETPEDSLRVLLRETYKRVSLSLAENS